MTNQEFISLHKHDNPRSLALKKAPEGVDLLWCLTQIEGWQTACRKLPRWADTEGLLYPPRLSMEQCSSEPTALYKRQLLEHLTPAGARTSFADITGGFGVDFSYMASLFDHAHYVEQQEVLCGVARHNMPLLGLAHATIHHTQSEAYLRSLSDRALSALYLDPARRTDSGQKTFMLSQCSPDLSVLLPLLLQKAEVVVVKLSPMLDITEVRRALGQCVSEIHVVSVKGECKELLLVLRSQADEPVVHCVNLLSHHPSVSLPLVPDMQAPVSFATPPFTGMYLCEPNASVLKAGVQDVVAHRLGLLKLSPMSHLYLSASPLSDYPGRVFHIERESDFSKRSLRDLTRSVPQANLTVRGFPMSVADLRKRLKIKEGGDVYMFAATTAEGEHVILSCRRSD